MEEKRLVEEATKRMEDDLMRDIMKEQGKDSKEVMNENLDNFAKMDEF